MRNTTTSEGDHRQTDRDRDSSQDPSTSPIDEERLPTGDLHGEVAPGDEDGLPDGPARYRVPS